MRTNRLLAVVAASAILAAPLAIGTAAMADNGNGNKPDSAGKPTDKPAPAGRKVGLSKLAFVGGPETNDTTKVRELTVSGTDVTVKVLTQVKHATKKSVASMAATWTIDAAVQTDLGLRITGKSKLVTTASGSVTVPGTTASGTVYCLTGVKVTDSAGAVTELDTSALNKGQKKKTCFTVVNAAPAP